MRYATPGTQARYVKKGDVGIPFDAALTEADGDPVNLTGATVRFLMTLPSSDTPEVDAAASVVGTATDGNVRYTSVAGDLDTVGTYFVEWKVTFGGGGVQRYPGDGYGVVAVRENLE